MGSLRGYPRAICEEDVEKAVVVVVQNKIYSGSKLCGGESGILDSPRGRN
jgi:hypothetical protein